MGENEPTPTIACTLTEEHERKRSSRIYPALVSIYEGFEEYDDGYTFVFTGTDQSLSTVAAFVAEERRCCSFVEYSIDTSPPYEETRLTVTGPNGTKAMFGEGLLDRLESEVS